MNFRYSVKKKKNLYLYSLRDGFYYPYNNCTDLFH